MRKRNKGRKLSMEKGPRVLFLRKLANNFFIHEKIKTTEARAKELRPVVEKMITRAKNINLANRRLLLTDLNPKVATKLIEKIAPEYKERKGGYTRITKLGPRPSDGAKVVIFELVK